MLESTQSATIRIRVGEFIMRTFRGQIRALGYSNEELWAYERNRELLRKLNATSAGAVHKRSDKDKKQKHRS